MSIETNKIAFYKFLIMYDAFEDFVMNFNSSGAYSWRSQRFSERDSRKHVRILDDYFKCHDPMEWILEAFPWRERSSPKAWIWLHGEWKEAYREKYLKYFNFKLNKNIKVL